MASSRTKIKYIKAKTIIAFSILLAKREGMLMYRISGDLSVNIAKVVHIMVISMSALLRMLMMISEVEALICVLLYLMSSFNNAPVRVVWSTVNVSKTGMILGFMLCR